MDDKNAAYDALAKKFLSRKEILAQILRFSDVKEELEKMGGLMEPLLNIAKKQAAKQATAETKRKVLLKNILNVIAGD